MIDYYHQKTHFLNHRTWLLFVISKGDMTCHAIEKQNFIWVKFGAAAFLYRLSICYCKYYILLKNHHDLVKNNLPLFFFHAEALDDRQRYINFSLRFFALWGVEIIVLLLLAAGNPLQPNGWLLFRLRGGLQPASKWGLSSPLAASKFFFEGRDFTGLLQRFHFQFSTRIRSHNLKFQ